MFSQANVKTTRKCRLRVDANFFENGEKKLRSQTNTDTCRQGLNQVCEDAKWYPPPLPFADIPVLSVRMWRKEFSLTWPAAMSIFWSKSKCLHKKNAQRIVLDTNKDQQSPRFYDMAYVSSCEQRSTHAHTQHLCMLLCAWLAPFWRHTYLISRERISIKM